ncbi:M3 family oligoendopeptidase [Sphingomonas morindae]|uniref:Oligoendopeptidase F family protein n=1 Tax=Sphingomonas morindae TaxID=1541170 RepID=A0ABY4XDG7_9SPHN|nr:M3 family oligoendopeptidase [Sphingomonas morindae]USI74735.1 oligoendopeptidase F family protein [Sphingomonas morindae]
MRSDLHRRDLLVSTLALAGAGSAAAQAGTQDGPGAPPASDAPAQWDLRDLYPSDAAWEADRQAVAALIARIGSYRGRLGTDAATLRAALQLQSDAQRQLGRLYTYASLKADEDVRIAANQERKQIGLALYGQAAEASAFTAPELLAIGRTRLEAFLAADPGLAKFRFQIEDVLRQQPHTLDAEAEAVIAATAVPFAGPGSVQQQLAASDIPRPTVTLSDGSRVRLDDQGYELHRDAPSRADRKLVFDQFWASYKQFENSMGANLDTQVRTEIFTARVRKFPNALSAALYGPAIPEAVYRTLVAEVNRGLPQFHRYLELRRRMLGLPDLHYYDIYPPLVTLPRRFTLEEMRALTLAAIAPLGPRYGALFAKATAARWMDPRPRTGKAPGAYMNPGAYDVHPYLLLNLSDKYDGLTTYAHEWGHAMHSLLGNAAQPFETASYPTFIAEIASTCHETLLAHAMLASARTKEEKLFYIGQQLETIRGTLYRQTMFAEFQAAIHDLAERGEGTSGGRFTSLYLDLLRRYHGPRMTIDPTYAAEWCFVPHFYGGFYVFQYATSITAATYFADQLVGGEAGARDRYLGVLQAGGSDYGYAILKKAGLDMASPAPYQAIIARFGALLDQAEALLG